MEVNKDLFGWMDSLLEFRAAQGFSTDKYRLYLGLFASFCRARHPGATELTARLANEWIAHEASGGHHSAACEKATVVRALGNYIRAFGGAAYVLPRETMKRSRTFSPHVFTDGELRSLFAAIDRSCRNRRTLLAVKGAYSVLFRLMFTCGLRPGEGRCVRREDVDIARGGLFVREAKCHKERKVGLSRPMSEMIRKYLRELDKVSPDSPWLFPTRSGRPVTKNALAKYFARCWSLANPGVQAKALPRVRVYDLRHRFASTVLQRWTDEGADLLSVMPVLRAYMGHSSLSSTLYYVHLLPDNLRRSSGVDWQRLGMVIPEDAE